MVYWFCLFVPLFLAQTSLAIMVHEVSAGAMAILDCPSNDHNHRFQYWETSDNKIIGPGNEINPYKYKYEVLTGTLFIKGVSSAESGFYKCVSKTISSPPQLQVESVELIVRKDWEELYENDTENNSFRAVTALTVLLVALLLLLFALKMRRNRPIRFRDLIDEESPDEAPITPRADVYRPTTLPSTSGSTARLVTTAGEDNLAVSVDTDFPTVFQSSHDERL